MKGVALDRAGGLDEEIADAAGPLVELESYGRFAVDRFYGIWLMAKRLHHAVGAFCRLSM